MSLFEKFTKKYDLDPFLANLFNWVDLFKIDDVPGNFSVLNSELKPSLYGVCDMIYNLKITNTLSQYLEERRTESVSDWIKYIQSYQDPRSGWFKEPGFNYGFHFKEHSTAFAISALRLLDAKPKYNLKIASKLKSRKKVRKWLKIVPEWGLFYWPGSHRGGGIGAIFATLGEDYYPHKDFFEWYFEWLDENADPEVGFWRLGWIHKIKKDRLTKHELGGAVHYYWVYEFFDRNFPYPEQIIDSTISLQTELNTWHKIYSYCIDLDAIFCLLRGFIQTNDYKGKEIEAALIKYLNSVIENMNSNEFLFANYQSAHKLTGYVCAIAEIYRFFPDIFDTKTKWIQTLDITPWI